MTEIWEKIFSQNQEMWGFEPAPSALIAKDFFIENGIKSMLIPGIGYGRNAKVFLDNGINVTGIEISKTAIELAHKHYGSSMKIHHGSVSDMPFEDTLYEGIFCYALVHLLDSKERKKFIQDAYNQLTENGYMIFVVVSKEAPLYGTGNFISKDRYEVSKGLSLYFYDEETIKAEFGNSGLFEITKINESLPFYIVKCKKQIND